jgi:hypothetical protein
VLYVRSDTLDEKVRCSRAYCEILVPLEADVSVLVCFRVGIEVGSVKLVWRFCVLFFRIHVSLVSLQNLRDSNERTFCLRLFVSYVLWCFMASGVSDMRVHWCKFHVMQSNLFTYRTSRCCRQWVSFASILYLYTCLHLFLYSDCIRTPNCLTSQYNYQE